jgi:hypothetical protein
MATPARTVQLRDANDVIQAYENWNIPQFAVISGKQLLFTQDDDSATVEDGVQLLKQWLNWIKKNGSTAIYTLAVYKNPKKEITNSTEYNGSVNFQLNEYNYNGNGAGITGANDAGIKMMMDSVNALQLQVQKLQDQLNEEEEEEEEKKPDMLGQITDFISNPIISGIISAFLPASKFLPKPVTPIQPQQQQPMQTEPGQVTRIAGVTEKDNQKRMADILKKLQGQVSNLPDILEQMSKLADTKPAQFEMYMAALMAMKL